MKNISLLFQAVPPSKKFQYILLVTARAATSILDVAGIALIGLVAVLFSSEITNTSTTELFGFKIETEDKGVFPLIIFFIFVLFALKALLTSLVVKSISKLIGEIDAANGKKIANYFFMGSATNLRNISAVKVQRALGDSSAQATFVTLSAFQSIFSDLTTLVLISVLFILISPAASVVVFLYFGIISLVLYLVMSNVQRKASSLLTSWTHNLMVSIDDSVDSYREIYVANKQFYFFEKLVQARDQQSLQRSKMYFWGTLPKFVVESALMMGVLGFAGWQLATGNLEQGLAVVGIFMAGGVRIMGAILPLQNSIIQLKTAQIQGELAFELLQESEQSSKKVVPESKQELSFRSNETAAAIKVSGVSYRHEKSSRFGIENLNLVLDKGKFAAVIGPSGAGKTTFVDLLLGLILPDKGSIHIDHIQPQQFIEQGFGRVSYVPQKPGLVSGTIAQNIALGVNDEDLDQDGIAEALNSAYLWDFVSSLPMGIHTEIGPGHLQLSGGQAQRLGLARALYWKPNLLILDEATSALDAESESFISESLEGLRGKVTILVVAHRLSTVQHADVVFLMEEGSVTAQGTFANLRKEIPLIETYVKLMEIRD